MSIFSTFARGPKPAKNIGHPVLCLGSGAKRQHWLPARTATSHILVEGDAGSGKTEFLLSAAWQTMLYGAPVVVVDGSTSSKVSCTLRTLAGMIGRADDVTILDLDPHRGDDGIAGDRLDIWHQSFDRKALAKAMLSGEDKSGVLTLSLHRWLEMTAEAYRAGDHAVRLRDLEKARQTLPDKHWAVLVQAALVADRAIGHLIARPEDGRRSSIGYGRSDIACIRLPQDDIEVRKFGAALVNLALYPSMEREGSTATGMNVIHEVGVNRGLAGLVAFDEVEVDTVERSHMLTFHPRALGLCLMATTASRHDYQRSDRRGCFTTSVNMGTSGRPDGPVVPGNFHAEIGWRKVAVLSGRGFLVSTMLAASEVSVADRLAWAPGD